MKRLTYIFLTLVSVSFFISSCNKCTECQHPDVTTGTDIYEEYCGSGSQVNAFEKEWSTNYDSIGGFCARK